MSTSSTAYSTLGTPKPAAVVSPRLVGTPWARSLAARTLYLGLDEFARWLGRVGISADAITWASLMGALAAGVAVALGHPGYSALLVLLSGSLDLLDGAVARATQTSSRWGALLDSTLDRVGDAAPLAGLAFFYADAPLAMAIPLIALVSGFVTSYVRARAGSLGVELPQLPMRRAERVLLLSASLLVGVPSWFAALPAPPMLVGVALCALMATVGAGMVLVVARRSLLAQTSKMHTRESQKPRLP